MEAATLQRLQAFAGDGRDFNGSYSRWVADRRHAIQDARSEGHTMQEIGEALGITRQRVHQLIHQPLGG